MRTRVKRDVRREDRHHVRLRYARWVIRFLTVCALSAFVVLIIPGCGDDSPPPEDTQVDTQVPLPDTAAPDTGRPCEMSCGPMERCCGPDEDRVCVDIFTDDNNCGGCGIRCDEGRGTSCVAARCVCGLTEAGCGGDTDSICCPPTGELTVNYCANLEQDLSDCGACGESCDRTKTSRCDGGNCYCGDRRDVCDGDAESLCCTDLFGETGCVNTVDNDQHCGGCNRRCELSERCVGDLCTRGEEECDSCERGQICCDGVCCARALCELGRCGGDVDAGPDAGDAGDAGPDAGDAGDAGDADTGA